MAMLGKTRGDYELPLPMLSLKFLDGCFVDAFVLSRKCMANSITATAAIRHHLSSGSWPKGLTSAW